MGAGLWTKDVKQNVSKYKEWKSLKGERRIEWGRHMNGKGSSKRWVGNEGKGKIGGEGLFHVPISAHYAHAQRGIIMQLVKCCGGWVFCKFGWQGKRERHKNWICINEIRKSIGVPVPKASQELDTA
jgi:hypothetical protein